MSTPITPTSTTTESPRKLASGTMNERVSGKLSFHESGPVLEILNEAESQEIADKFEREKKPANARFSGSLVFSQDEEGQLEAYIDGLVSTDNASHALKSMLPILKLTDPEKAKQLEAASKVESKAAKVSSKPDAHEEAKVLEGLKHLDSVLSGKELSVRQRGLKLSAALTHRLITGINNLTNNEPTQLNKLLKKVLVTLPAKITDVLLARELNGQSAQKS